MNKSHDFSPTALSTSPILHSAWHLHRICPSALVERERLAVLSLCAGHFAIQRFIPVFFTPFSLDRSFSMIMFHLQICFVWVGILCLSWQSSACDLSEERSCLRCYRLVSSLTGLCLTQAKQAHLDKRCEPFCDGCQARGQLREACPAGFLFLEM